MTLVLASHLPGEGYFRSERYQVRPLLCEGDRDYWRGLVLHWDHPGTLINVEHDVEVTDEHIDALLACDEPLCSWVYPLHWASTHQKADVLPPDDAEFADF